ncbi:hypothetical protein G7070_11650 [Propioniciclava coleopterorum]|uniref:Uncharacterized protein n=1 Tax=Propioniciclava coleopterorum TaxID=2714937 RepID=A0A6G7Y831_9ACTN|nr:hypothetical protein [Propioniciclava coleopterorum]QIK72808.1 hypothetical protein G7070_11650 [Propioniciclava coleopterorum]
MSQLTSPTLISAGVVLLTVLGIGYGGTFLLRILNGGLEFTPFQKSSFRAGHAHAGVLVTLGLVVALFVDLSGGRGLLVELSYGVLFAAIFIPAGFFFGAMGRGRTRPGPWFNLLWVGVASLAVGLISGAVVLIQAGLSS